MPACLKCRFGGRRDFRLLNLDFDRNAKPDSISTNSPQKAIKTIHKHNNYSNINLKVPKQLKNEEKNNMKLKKQLKHAQPSLKHTQPNIWLFKRSNLACIPNQP